MKKSSLILLGASFILLFMNLVSSVTVGISPASLEFNNVLRGGYTEDDIFITINSEKQINVTAETFGEIKDWINFSADSALVSKGNPHNLVVYVRPPVDVPNGNYSGFVRVRTSTFGEAKEGHLTGKVLSSVDLKVDIEVTDKELLSCDVFSAGINVVETGYDSILNLGIRNNGNIWIYPDVFVKIWDRDQTEIVYTDNFGFSQIFPTKKGSETFDLLISELPVGQYFAEVEVPDCKSKRVVTFDVLEEGALRANGVFTSLLARGEGKVGEIIPVEANFRNTGEKVVNAKFVGEVVANNEIVKVFDTDLIGVQMGEVERFSLRFVPSDAGKHIVKGRFVYDNKKTFEKSAVIEVYGGVSPWMYLVYGILILGIVFLLYKLHKEKGKLGRRLDRL